MSLFVVSDLHISGPEDPLYHSLLLLLQRKAQTGDTVVLAGDLFDLFVGSKAIFTQTYAKFLQALKECGERGVACHYIEGNHDFHLDRVFSRIKNVKLYPNEFSLLLHDKRFYFAHGDLVLKDDYGYRLLRLFFRSKIMKLLFHLAPGKWVASFGNFSSRTSQKKHRRSPLAIERLEEIRRSYRSYAAEKLADGFDFVVMGHCHDLDEMSFQIGGRMGQYVNVGYPRKHGSFVSWSPGDTKMQRERLPE